MIDWFGFVTVAITTLVSAGFVVTMYSLGVRFTAVSADESVPSNQLAKWGAYVCFGFCVLTVVLGIVLIVPHLNEPFFALLDHLF